MSLKVVHVIGGGDTGGAMAHLLPLVAALRGEGCEAELLCLGGGGLAEAAIARGIPVEVLPMSSPWDPRVLPPLRRRLVAGGFDIVHTHGMRANLPVRSLWPLVRRRPSVTERPCLFTTVHSDLSLDYPDPRQAELYGLLDRASRRLVDQMVYVSAELRERAEPRGRQSRAVVIRSGVEFAGGATEAVSDGPCRAGSAVAAAVWAGDPPGPEELRVGTVARLVPVKDIGLLLEVAARLHRAATRVRVAVIGDGPERGRLETRAAELGLDGVVTFAGDVRPGAEALREFDVFVLTSRSEGIPVAVLEAMAAGVPVVATAVGGLREAVEDGVTGYLVPRQDRDAGAGEQGGSVTDGIGDPGAGGDRAALSDALGERVSRLLADGGLRARMGTAAARAAREGFSAEVAARATLRAYRRCLAGCRGEV